MKCFLRNKDLKSSERENNDCDEAEYKNIGG